jgi:hypothetical protein
MPRSPCRCALISWYALACGYAAGDARLAGNGLSRDRLAGKRGLPRSARVVAGDRLASAGLTRGGRVARLRGVGRTGSGRTVAGLSGSAWLPVLRLTIGWLAGRAGVARDRLSRNGLSWVVAGLSGGHRLAVGLARSRWSVTGLARNGLARNGWLRIPRRRVTRLLRVSGLRRLCVLRGMSGLLRMSRVTRRPRWTVVLAGLARALGVPGQGLLRRGLAVARALALPRWEGAGRLAGLLVAGVLVVRGGAGRGHLGPG